MIRASIVTFLALLSICAGSASRPSDDQERTQLVRWILETGKPSLIRGRVAAAMGLGDEDIVVVERGFRKIGDDITHVMTVKVGVGPFSDNFLCFARINEGDGSGTIWKTSMSGQLQMTVLIDPDTSVKALANEGQQIILSEEKTYFLAKMRESRDKSAR